MQWEMCSNRSLERTSPRAQAKKDVRTRFCEVLALCLGSVLQEDMEGTEVAFTYKAMETMIGIEQIKLLGWVPGEFFAGRKLVLCDERLV